MGILRALLLSFSFALAVKMGLGRMDDQGRFGGCSGKILMISARKWHFLEVEKDQAYQ